MNELIQLLITLLPAIAGVSASVVSVLLSIKKVSSIIAEFRQSNELKQLIEQLKQEQQQNEQLKTMNEKLLVELTKIKPQGWVDE